MKPQLKITCPRTELTEAFAIVSGIVPSRTPKPILQNVKIEATDAGVVLTATDQEVGIRYALQTVIVAQPGEALLPANRMLAILREMQGPEVTIEVQDNTIRIRGERSDFKLGAVIPDEFPNVAAFDEQNSVTVPAGALKRMIQRTVFAADTESTRYALGGALVEIKGESITFAATDTRRLAVMRGGCQVVGQGGSESDQPVIPAKALKLITASIPNGQEPVSLAIRKTHALVKAGQATIYTRLVEGRFPRWQDVVPAKCDKTVDLIVGPFYSAVRQSQIFTNEESRGVDFGFEPGLLTLASQTADIGQSKVELPISYDGQALTITFDPKYIADLLRVLEPEQSIQVGMTDGENAALFRTDDGYMYVAMPLSRDR